MSSEQKILTRDVEASVVPIGTKVTLQKGETAHITQSLGGTYTVIVNGNMFRIESKDADALGIEISVAPAASATATPSGPLTQEQLEKKVWESLKTCYDPEIPVNIVDLGLIYDCHLTPIGENNFKADVKMTLTAPGWAWARCSRRTCRTNSSRSNRLTRPTSSSYGIRRGTKA